MFAGPHYRHVQRTFRASQFPEKGLGISRSGRTVGRSRNPQEYPARAPRKLHSRVGLPPTSFPLSPSSHHGSRSRDKERIEKGWQRSELNLSQLASYPTIPSPPPLSSSIPDTIPSLTFTILSHFVSGFSLSFHPLHCRAGATDRPTSRDDSNGPLFNFEIKEGKTAIRGKLDGRDNGGSIKSVISPVGEKEYHLRQKRIQSLATLARPNGQEAAFRQVHNNHLHAGK